MAFLLWGRRQSRARARRRELTEIKPGERARATRSPPARCPTWPPDAFSSSRVIPAQAAITSAALATAERARCGATHDVPRCAGAAPRLPATDRSRTSATARPRSLDDPAAAAGLHDLGDGGRRPPPRPLAASPRRPDVRRLCRRRRAGAAAPSRAWSRPARATGRSARASSGIRSGRVSSASARRGATGRLRRRARRRGAGARAAPRPSERKALWRLFVAVFCMMQVMMYQAPLYIAAPGTMSADLRTLLLWAAWLLSIPVVLFSAAPMFREAWEGLRQRRIGMDLPVSIGIALTFVVSTGATFAPGPMFGSEAWFDSLTMFVSFLLAGRWLALKMRNRVAASLEGALSRLPERGPRRRRRRHDDAGPAASAAARRPRPRARGRGVSRRRRAARGRHRGRRGAAHRRVAAGRRAAAATRRSPAASTCARRCCSAPSASAPTPATKGSSR